MDEKQFHKRLEFAKKRGKSMIKSSVKIGDADKIPAEIPLKITIDDLVDICAKKGVGVSITLSEKERFFYIYRIHPDGHESKFIADNKTRSTVYDYRGMLGFTKSRFFVQNNYRVEEIK